MFKNKYGKVRSGWKILFVSLAFILGSFLVQLLFGIVTGIVLMLTNNAWLIAEISNPGTDIAQTVAFVERIISSLSMILAPIIAWKFIMKRKLSDMGLTSFRLHWKDLLAGLLLGAITISIIFVLFLLTGSAHVETWKPKLTSDTFTYLITFVLVGFGEEIYGRGFIMGALKQTKSYPLIYIFSSVFFALLHGGNAGFSIIPFINLTLVGLLFAYMFVKSNNIWMCIGFHITWNYFQGNIYGLSVSGNDVEGFITTIYDKQNIFTGLDFGPEGGLFVTIILLLSFLFVRAYYKNANQDFLASEKLLEEPIFTDYPDHMMYQDHPNHMMNQEHPQKRDVDTVPMEDNYKEIDK